MFQKLAFLGDPYANTQALCRRAHGDIPEVFAFGIHAQLDAKPLRLSCLSRNRKLVKMVTVGTSITLVVNYNFRIHIQKLCRYIR